MWIQLTCAANVSAFHVSPLLSNSRLQTSTKCRARAGGQEMTETCAWMIVLHGGVTSLSRTAFQGANFRFKTIFPKPAPLKKMPRARGRSRDDGNLCLDDLPSASRGSCLRMANLIISYASAHSAWQACEALLQDHIQKSTLFIPAS